MSVWSFRFLLWFICVMFTAPQNRFPFLSPLHIADLSVMGAVGMHLLSAGQRGGILKMGPASVLTILLMLFGLLSQYTGALQTDTRWNGYIDILMKSSTVALLVEATCTSVKRVWLVQLTLLLATLWWIKGGLRLSSAGATCQGDRLMGPAVGLVENPNGFAYMMCVILPTYLYFFIHFRTVWMRWCALGLAIADIFITLRTGSRTGMLCLIAIGAFLLPRYGAQRKLALTTVAVAIVLLSSSIGALNIERFKSIPQSLLHFFGAGEEKDVHALNMDEQSAYERRMKNHDTWRLIKEYPLFGIGMNPDQSLYAEEFPFATGQVHNELLMAGREMGIIGMTLHLSLLATLFALGVLCQRHFAGWWPAAADLGWTFKVQAVAFAVGGFFSPLPWSAPFMILVASCSALWGLRYENPRPARV